MHVCHNQDNGDGTGMQSVESPCLLSTFVVEVEFQCIDMHDECPIWHGEDILRMTMGQIE